MANFNVLSDGAVRKADKDFLRFDRYVKPLISVFTDPRTETPFTVGVFGTWGSGKSSLLALLNDELENHFPDKFVRVQFNPWMHRHESNMLVPLLHALQDTLQKDRFSRFAESAKKVANILIQLGADFLLKRLTTDAVSLKDLKELEKEYFEQRNKVESEIRTLHQTLQAQADAIGKHGAKIALFIDDLDRCDPGQIIDLLEAVKIFFDLRHVFIVLAVDKEVIDRGIQVKYHEFKFAERAPAIGAEYLEKMVQLPLQLFPLDVRQVGNFIERLQPPATVLNQVALLRDVLAPNPRKITRILNILAVTHAIRAAMAGPPLRPDLLARLVVLQVQSPELYAEVARQPEFLLALERLFLPDGDPQKIRVEEEGDFRDFGSRREAVQALCKQYS